MSIIREKLFEWDHKFFRDYLKKRCYLYLALLKFVTMVILFVIINLTIYTSVITKQILMKVYLINMMGIIYSVVNC